MGGSGGFRFLWLLGGELDELEEDELDELDELEHVLGWQGRFHPNRPSKVTKWQRLGSFPFCTTW